jgi:hypothetical protein
MVVGGMEKITEVSMYSTRPSKRFVLNVGGGYDYPVLFNFPEAISWSTTGPFTWAGTPGSASQAGKRLLWWL